MENNKFTEHQKEYLIKCKSKLKTLLERFHRRKSGEESGNEN